MSLTDPPDSPGLCPPSREKCCLLIIDMINLFDFPEAARMFPAVLHVAEHIAQLKRRARTAGVPAIYVMINFCKGS